MKKLYFIIATSILLSACSADEVATDDKAQTQALTFTTDIQPFSGDVQTRANLEGNAFVAGDLIRLKILCPFTSSQQMGESTNGNTPDGFYYLKATGDADPNSAWTTVTSADGFDLTGSYSASTSPAIGSYYEAQQTPYVFTAETWSEEKHFIVGGNLYVQSTNVFHHDQRKEKHHLASDVLWAQTIMQTGGTNFHLSFQHKMALLDITVNGFDGGTVEHLSDQAYLTLEKMPNIDQAEIIIGNYYADTDKYGTSYGYKQKTSCGYDYNGKVIGVAEIDETAKRAKLRLLPGGVNPGRDNNTIGSAITCDGVYTAYKVANNQYRLMVPPCTLTNNAVFWLRDGERRYSVNLEQLTFESSKMYNVTLTLGSPEP